MSHHVVVGAGPVGHGTALELAGRGTAVTVVTRSGSGPEHPLVTRLALDATDADALTGAAKGAAAIYNCANPPYHRWPEDWPPLHAAMMAAAERTGAVLVMTDNLYAFGPGATMPMQEGDPMRATGRKGAMRARMATELLDAHSAGRLRATLARASDFYGPGVLGSAMGDRVVPKVLAGKKVSVLGGLDVPHSFSYMPDVVRTLTTIATDERAWGRAWHVPNAPAVSQRQFVTALAAAAGTTAKVGAVPKGMIGALGLFVPMMRELKETWYQFAEPFVSPGSAAAAVFGLTPTPLVDGAAATVAWWKAQPTGK